MGTSGATNISTFFPLLISSFDLHSSHGRNLGLQKQLGQASLHPYCRKQTPMVCREETLEQSLRGSQYACSKGKLVSKDI